MARQNKSCSRGSCHERPSMTTSSNSAEPTMDEILASIRRIVSDEPTFGKPAADRRGVNPLIEPKVAEDATAAPTSPEGAGMWRPINRPPLPQPPAAAPHQSPSPASALPPGMPPLTSVAPPGSASFDADLDDLLDDAPPSLPKQPEPALPPFSAAPPRPTPPQDDMRSRWSALRSDLNDEPAPLRAEPSSSPDILPEPRAAGGLPPSPPPFLPSFGAPPALPTLSSAPAIAETPPSPPRTSGFFPPPPRDLPKLEPMSQPAAPAARSLDELIADIKAGPGHAAPATVSAVVAAPAPLPPPSSTLSPSPAPAEPVALSVEPPKAETRTEPAVETAVAAPPVTPAVTKEEPIPAVAAAAAPATQAAEAPPAAAPAALKEAPKEAAPVEPAAVPQPAAAADPAPRTLEDVVADMVRPMLEKWIGENMPRIIEKALRGEMKK